MKYIINCFGCGRAVQDFVPLPGKGANIEVECSHCGFLLAIFEGDPE